MRIQAYTVFDFTLQITVATPRAEPLPSTHFYAASIHEDYCAQVDDLLLEHKHVGESMLAYPAAKRLASYFPQVLGKPIYGLRQLMPLGAPRDVDADYQLEVMRIRYAGVVNLLPEAFLGDQVTARALSRNLQSAMRELFKSQGVAIDSLFIPGDRDPRLGDRTDIDFIAEMGAASGRTGVEIPNPPSV